MDNHIFIWIFMEKSKFFGRFTKFYPQTYVYKSKVAKLSIPHIFMQISFFIRIYTKFSVEKLLTKENGRAIMI